MGSPRGWPSAELAPAGQALYSASVDIMRPHALCTTHAALFGPAASSAPPGKRQVVPGKLVQARSPPSKISTAAASPGAGASQRTRASPPAVRLTTTPVRGVTGCGAYENSADDE